MAIKGNGSETFRKTSEVPLKETTIILTSQIECYMLSHLKGIICTEASPATPWVPYPFVPHEATVSLVRAAAVPEGCAFSSSPDSCNKKGMIYEACCVPLFSSVK